MPAKPRKPVKAADGSGQPDSTGATSSGSADQEPVKVSSLYDAHGLKGALDECARDVVVSSGYEEDYTTSNIKIGLGLLAIAIALYAQFGLGKFPANWWPLFYCVAAYVVVSTSMNVYLHYFEVDSFLICKPRRSVRLPLRLASRMKRYSDQYTLIMSLGLKRQEGYREVQFTASVQEFFHKDKYLSEAAFKPKVEQLLTDFEAAVGKKTQ